MSNIVPRPQSDIGDSFKGWKINYKYVTKYFKKFKYLHKQYRKFEVASLIPRERNTYNFSKAYQYIISRGKQYIIYP